jgi:hypothetical protein
MDCNSIMMSSGKAHVACKSAVVARGCEESAIVGFIGTIASSDKKNLARDLSGTEGSGYSEASKFL